MPHDVSTLRHYEDLVTGEVVPLGRTTLTREMITGFAREFDPFPFHLDEEAARRSLLGGLAASGWQTGALTLRMLVDSFLSTIVSLGGLGFTDLKWKRPVFVGDTITGTATISALRRSASHPQWGIVTLALDVANLKGEQVMTMNLNNLVGVRTPGPASMPTPSPPYDVTHAGKDDQ